jgi:hypothetical protein
MHSEFPFIKYKPNFVCDACHLGKQSKLPFPNNNHRCKTKFEIVHMDIWGPLNIDCTHGHRYLLTMVDDFTRHTWIHIMKSKSDVKHLIIKFIAYVKNQFNCSIKTIRSDNGPEFLLTDLFDSHGILHQRSCVETPEQNFVVERKHRHIQNVARSFLFHSGIPKCYWCFIFCYVVHIINCLPSRLLKQKSPFQLLHGKSPSLLDLKTFGCLCYATTTSQNRKKLDPRAIKCCFLGFKQGVKGFILLDLQTNNVFISRNVVFKETFMPFKSAQPSNVASDSLSSNHRFDNIFYEPWPME